MSCDNRNSMKTKDKTTTSSIPAEREWLSYQEGSIISGMSVPTLRRWARDGRLKVSRLSVTAVRIHRGELRKLLEEGMV